VFDVDSPTLGGATIQIASGFVTTDQLFVNLATDAGTGHLKTPDGVVTGISASYAAGTLMLTGSSSIQDYQAVLDAVSYRSTAADPTNGGSNSHRTITWTVSDGSLNSQTPNTDPDNLVNGHAGPRPRCERGGQRLHHRLHGECRADRNRRYRRVAFLCGRHDRRFGNRRADQCAGR
jgi:hypothetical protein